MAGPDPPNLAAELAELRRAVAGLTEAVRELAQGAHPPVHVSVGQMEVERLAFFVPSIDVEEISGALNIGITHLIGPGPGDGKPAAEVHPEAPPPDPAAAVELWPYRNGEGERP
ncbi:MAG TPA: hypothetical protein VNT75_33175 [Symbiobacteriaceae bacterium]|nr:hypothetical protein [Symbiobacteriaceae bacterium]